MKKKISNMIIGMVLAGILVGCGAAADDGVLSVRQCPVLLVDIGLQRPDQPVHIGPALALDLTHDRVFIVQG